MPHSSPQFVFVLAATVLFLCAQLPSSMPFCEAAFVPKSYSSAPTSTDFQPTAASTSTSNATTIEHQRRARHSALVNITSLDRVPRAPILPYPAPPEPAQNRYPTFTILAILPEENAPLITRALRDAQAKWEVSEHISVFATERPNSFSRSSNRPPASIGNSIGLLRASDIPLVVYSEPANNDTERLLSSVCQWISVHQPVMVLSLLDKQRNFYASLVAESTGIPFVSLTQTYRNEISTVSDDHQLEVSSSISRKWPPSKRHSIDLYI
jgi:hypothetical protein